MKEAGVRLVRALHWGVVVYFLIATGASASRTILAHPAWAALNFWAMLSSFILFLANKRKCILTELENKLKGVSKERYFFPEWIEKKFKIKLSPKASRFALIVGYLLNIFAYIFN